MKRLGCVIYPFWAVGLMWFKADLQMKRPEGHSGGCDFYFPSGYIFLSSWLFSVHLELAPRCEKFKWSSMSVPSEQMPAAAGKERNPDSSPRGP